MAELTQEERRRNRKIVLDALKNETGSSGGDAAAARVEAYRADPLGAAPDEFIYVGALVLRRFYVDPDKPNQSERRGLWQAIRSAMDKSVTPVPADIDASMPVRTLQMLAEQRP